MLNYKLQITNYKQIPNSKIQNYKLLSLGHLVISYCILFVICLLCIGIYSNAYALNLDTLKVNFLKGDYKAAILEGEKIIGQSQQQSLGLDELYYLLGLSYLKEGNLLRASDIFEIILKEFKNSTLKEEASLALGDSYFLGGNLLQAEKYYKELISNNSGAKLKAQVFYRLSQIGAKLGNTQEAEDYSGKLKENFPLSLEVGLSNNVPAVDFYYTVQVGSFTSSVNAHNLLDRLTQRGYLAYIEELNSINKTIYRVRIGKTRSRKEAEELERKLSQEGYPTKICP